MVINSCSINVKKFLFLSVEEVALTVSAKPLVALKALCPEGALPLVVCLPGSGLTPVSVICLLSPREGNTMTRGGICWNGLGAHLVGRLQRGRGQDPRALQQWAAARERVCGDATRGRAALGSAWLSDGPQERLSGLWLSDE